MPADALAPPGIAPGIMARRRRAGLRVAFAVAVGLTFDVATGAVVPFLGAQFAAQFLLSGAGPMPPAKALGLTVLVWGVGQALILLSGLFGDRPAQLLAVLGLFYFLCFLMQARGKGGPAALLCLIIAVMVPLLDRVHGQLDTGIIAVLLQGCLGGVGLSWLAHAVIPERAAPDEVPEDAPPQATGGVERPVLPALANAAILLTSVAFCLANSAFSTALVIPITVASLLVRFDPAAGPRAALGLVLVNLLGGVLASVAFAFVELRPSLPFLFLTILLVGLVLGGAAASAPSRAPIYGGVLTTFLILFGTGVSPLPTTTPESFATRIGYVVLAVAYSLCMTSLLRSRRRTGGMAGRAPHPASDPG